MAGKRSPKVGNKYTEALEGSNKEGVTAYEGPVNLKRGKGVSPKETRAELVWELSFMDQDGNHRTFYFHSRKVLDAMLARMKELNPNFEISEYYETEDGTLVQPN